MEEIRKKDERMRVQEMLQKEYATCTNFWFAEIPCGDGGLVGRFYHNSERFEISWVSEGIFETFSCPEEFSERMWEMADRRELTL